MYGRHRKRTPWRPSMTSIRNTAAVSAPGLRPRGSLEKAARSQLVELRTDRVRSAAPPAGSRESVGHPPPPGLVADRAMTYVNVPSTPHAEEFGFEAFGTDRIGVDVLRIDVAKQGDSGGTGIVSLLSVHPLPTSTDGNRKRWLRSRR